MATVTFQHSSFADGLVRVEFDVNDANWRMSQVRCINNSGLPVTATVHEAGALRYAATCEGHATRSWNTTGVQLGWDAVEGGLMMGAYVMRAAWGAN